MIGKSGMLGANRKKGWSVSTASYVRSLNILSQDPLPRGIAFKHDGTRMYVVGRFGVEINEYSLSTPWDVSSASYVRRTSIQPDVTAPLGLAFKTDGTKAYVVDLEGDDVSEYSLSTAWDISTASYAQSFSVASQDTSPSGLSFKSDGAKMYVTGFVGENVYEYSLSTAWDISTASYAQSFSVASQETTPNSVAFKANGLSMYVMGSDNANVNEYSLSTAWDISTASYAQAFSVASQDATPAGLTFKTDGTRMYVTGSENPPSTFASVFEYSLA